MFILCYYAESVLSAHVGRFPKQEPVCPTGFCSQSHWLVPRGVLVVKQFDYHPSFQPLTVQFFQGSGVRDPSFSIVPLMRHLTRSLGHRGTQLKSGQIKTNKM